jgi:hypothetical protein
MAVLPLDGLYHSYTRLIINQAGPVDNWVCDPTVRG